LYNGDRKGKKRELRELRELQGQKGALKGRTLQKEKFSGENVSGT
jgi:hypothetical protein